MHLFWCRHILRVCVLFIALVARQEFDTLISSLCHDVHYTLHVINYICVCVLALLLCDVVCMEVCSFVAYTCNSWSRQLDVLFMFPEAVSTWSALSSRWLHSWNIALNESHCASKDKFSRYFSSNWGMQIQYWILWMNVYVILPYVQRCYIDVYRI